MDPLPDAAAIIEFGRFKLLRHRRELLADGQPIELGGRAFDVLLAFIDAPGAFLTKDELMGRVWPGRMVEEDSLQAQVSALRKALGADRDLIRTVAGRGYQFTGEIRVLSVTASPRPASNLPEPISELIGRETAMVEVSDLMMAHRLVTLAGIGGMGKTRLGLEVARQLLPGFSDGVWIAELGPLSDPELVPVTVATALGLSLEAGSISPQSIAAALGSKRVLLVLDNCEHVIEEAAGMAEALLRASPASRVLTTSREPLRAEGEHVYQVPPLDVPAEDNLDMENVLEHGAVKLFIARARGQSRDTCRTSAWQRSKRGFAGISTASRSRSSSPQRASLRSGSKESRPASTTGSDSSQVATARLCRATRQCARHSTGATSCSPIRCE
jgi:DNA-binding winged helix-turn-helix (wHTH) protein